MACAEKKHPRSEGNRKPEVHLENGRPANTKYF
jgi:hypothetical protein